MTTKKLLEKYKTKMNLNSQNAAKVLFLFFDKGRCFQVDLAKQ